jgi:hypothetical protein
MITVFPSLYPAETVYSAIARYQELFAFPSARSTSVALFATRNHSAVPDFPSLLDVLVSRLPLRAPYTAEQLIQEHTVLPYYRLVAPVDRYCKAVRAMRSMERVRVGPLVGLAYSGVRRQSHLRFCALCVATDRVAVGEAYWRREHQLAGVLVCPQHGTPLANGVARRTDMRGEFLYTTLESFLETSDGSTPHWLSLSIPTPVFKIAVWSQQLLGSKVSGHHPDVFGRVYLPLLLRCDREVRRRRVNWLHALERVRATFGEEYLSSVLSKPDVERYAHRWLEKLGRPQGHASHPLSHLLLLASLGLSVEDLIERVEQAAVSQLRSTRQPSRVWQHKRLGGPVNWAMWRARDEQLLPEVMLGVQEILLSPSRPVGLTRFDGHGFRSS